MPPQGRKWTFTYFLPDGDESTLFRTSRAKRVLQEAVTHAGDAVEYLVCQPEMAPDTGRLHLQGYVRLLRPRRRHIVQRLLFGNARPHLELARGTDAQNKVYCTKEASRVPGSSPMEIGVMQHKKPGTRTDLLDLHEAIKDGASLEQLFDRYTASTYRYLKAVDRAIQLYPPPPRDRMCVIFMSGLSGVGKTYAAMRLLFPERLRYRIPLGCRKQMWFSGISKNHDVLVLDELTPTTLPGEELLQVLDGEQLQLPTKGGHAWANYSVVIITTNYGLRDFIEALQGPEAETKLRRRIMYHRHFVQGHTRADVAAFVRQIHGGEQAEHEFQEQVAAAHARQEVGGCSITPPPLSPSPTVSGTSVGSLETEIVPGSFEDDYERHLTRRFRPIWPDPYRPTGPLPPLLDFPEEDVRTERSLSETPPLEQAATPPFLSLEAEDARSFR